MLLEPRGEFLYTRADAAQALGARDEILGKCVANKILTPSCISHRGGVSTFIVIIFVVVCL